jgi:hypothetical protein
MFEYTRITTLGAQIAFSCFCGQGILAPILQIQENKILFRCDESGELYENPLDQSTRCWDLESTDDYCIFSPEKWELLEYLSIVLLSESEIDLILCEIEDSKWKNGDQSIFPAYENCEYQDLSFLGIIGRFFEEKTLRVVKSKTVNGRFFVFPIPSHVNSL